MRIVGNQEFKSLVSSHAVTKDIELRKDALATVEVHENARTLTFTISTDDVDQVGDVILQDGWDLAKFLRHPRVLWNHDAEKVIGKCVWIGVRDNKLKATVEFLPADNAWMGQLADGIYNACLGGFLNSTSVGFRPLAWEESADDARAVMGLPGLDITAAELSEFSIVVFPCNLNAVIEQPSAAALPPKNAPALRRRSMSRLKLGRMSWDHNCD